MAKLENIWKRMKKGDLDKMHEDKGHPLEYLVMLPYSYRMGNNPCGDNAGYYCHSCDLELFGREIGYVVSGTEYANGEYSKCPRCGKENYVERDEKI